jgi:lipid-binding SYLF domain-containing protein
MASGIGRSNGVAVGAELVNLPTAAGRAALAAGPLGAGQERATDTRFRAPVLTYTRSSGLFAGAVVSGAVVTQDNDATLALYGKHLDLRQILAGEVKTPPLAKDFAEAIESAVAAASGR